MEEKKKQTVIEVAENIELGGIIDAFGQSIAKQAKEYFGITIEDARVAKIYTIDAEINKQEIKKITEAIFQKPTKMVAINKSFVSDFDFVIWWGLKSGVKDNEGEVAKDAIEFLIDKKINGVYVSSTLFFRSKLDQNDLEKIVSLIANSNIETWEIIPRERWNVEKGIGPKTSIVEIEKEPEFEHLNLDVSEQEFLELDKEHNWALSTGDFCFLREYFYSNKEFQLQREKAGLTTNPTDIEIECLAQSLSDHCAHRTFHGKFHYREYGTSKVKTIDDPFKLFIKSPSKEIAKNSEWVVSVLDDNAGGMFLDKQGDYVFCLKGETHNSPSNKEPYGGSYTGIAGVFRDIMGFGRGLKVIMGLYGFAVGSRNYNGNLMPEIHPRQLLDGVISGVRDGGNKHGIPTVFGNVFFDESYVGKSLVYVTTAGISKRIVAEKPIEEKEINPGDLLVIYGGRTGIDGIHGVTEASMGFSERITMGHVQKGDSFLQRKASEFLEEVTEKGLLNLSWDLGGGGMSSAISETASFSNGVKVDLENVSLKYKGLDLWQIWVSESQERMLAAVPKDKIDEFLELAKLHDVETMVMGEYTDSGVVHILYKGKTVAYLPLELLYQKPPQWEFEAEWIPAEARLCEPKILELENYEDLLKEILARENICSKEWVTRQYDHEVKGSSSMKHMAGVNKDIQASAVAIRPVLGRKEGIAIAQNLNPSQSKIDTYWMTMNVLDEAVRRVTAIGGIRFENGVPERIGLIDNFCWPEIRYGKDNLDGKYKAAQLIRSLEALAKFQIEFGAPLLSGKDSMYIDGWLEKENGEKEKVSGLPCLQVTAATSIDDIEKCVSLDFKHSGDLIYVIGETKNELGASELYDMLDCVGLNIPKANIETLKRNTMAVSIVIEKEIVASSQAITRGGFIVDLAKMAMAGNVGVNIDLKNMPMQGVEFDYQALYSETASRFIIAINPKHKKEFEKILNENNCDYGMVGRVVTGKEFVVIGVGEKEIIRESVDKLKQAYKKRFGGLI